jgi:hypothetical protein
MNGPVNKSLFYMFPGPLFDRSHISIIVVTCESILSEMVLSLMIESKNAVKRGDDTV